MFIYKNNEDKWATSYTWKITTMDQTYLTPLGQRHLVYATVVGYTYWLAEPGRPVNNYDCCKSRCMSCKAILGTSVANLPVFRLRNYY